MNIPAASEATKRAQETSSKRAIPLSDPTVNQPAALRLVAALEEKAGAAIAARAADGDRSLTLDMTYDAMFGAARLFDYGNLYARQRNIESLDDLDVPAKPGYTPKSVEEIQSAREGKTTLYAAMAEFERRLAKLGYRVEVDANCILTAAVVPGRYGLNGRFEEPAVIGTRFTISF